MDAIALAAIGTTYTDMRGTTWHTDLSDDGDLVLTAAGNPTRRTYEDVDDAWGPLVRSSFTAVELTTIAEALAGGPAAVMRDRLVVLALRAREVESLLPKPADA
ncbi:hypothetical protein ACIRPH_31175 [Nocardiopsis sp. NPDC101807]|uniref:hypothetical protein n=1 Tax=Nocardiopsis sp. NPDC101807 TaxID=3364339 RepID=UPI0037FDAE33